MQTKRHSVLEAIVNTVIGLVVSFLTQLVVYPLFGIEISLIHNVYITIIFFIISTIRSYTLRRIFNKLTERKNHND